ncbi:hypothetical protein FSP39_011980 [Pinctada imbricata]|uniref:C2H2-type domain-containing protein n=1 Tax=Pinctada imbricata TaxID=66713 RepID=A0AA88YSU7_PINIB|nr:hypothetical protein FSP39_011980 [Pinctada imbricata]
MTVRDLQSHCRNIHKALNSFECGNCKATFSSAFQYNRHRRQCGQKFPCSQCKETFSTKVLLQNHRRYHCNGEECGPYTHRIRRPMAETMWVTPITMIICKECGKFFDTAEDLQEHIKEHEGITPAQVKFSCKECGKWFDQARYLHTHYRTAHKLRKSICSYCGLILDSPSDLRTHVSEKHDIAVQMPNSCSLCQKTFESLDELKKHVDEHVKNTKILHCPKCRDVFHSRSALEQHLSSEHKGKFKVSCPVCKKGFMQRGKLRIHMMVHKEVRPYQCDMCGMCFKMQCTLLSHIKRHEGKSVHKCNYCDKKFRSIEGARNHMLKHHINPEEARKMKFKVYTCEHCGKMMGQKHLYMRHVRLHTGHRPWQCEECGKTFTIPSALNTHKKIHLQRKPYHCDVCNLGCVDFTKFTKHLQTTKHQMNLEKKSLKQKKKVTEPDNEEEAFLENWDPSGLELPCDSKGQPLEFRNVFNIQNMIKKAEESTAPANVEVPEIGIENGGSSSNIVISIPQGISPDMITQLLQSGQLQAADGNIFLSPSSLDGAAEMSDSTADAVAALLS